MKIAFFHDAIAIIQKDWSYFMCLPKLYSFVEALMLMYLFYYLFIY